MTSCQMIEPMRGFSLIEPWAALVAAGEKRYETRSWTTSYRGLVLIHASSRMTKQELTLCGHPVFQAALRRGGFAPWHLPLGAAIAIARLIDVRPTAEVRPYVAQKEREFGDFSDDRYAWQLGGVWQLRRPIVMPGALGLWVPKPAKLEQLRNALKGGPYAGVLVP